MVGELDQPRSSELRYTPYLLIRSSVSDLGARPLPQGAVFWESPDVWVAGPDGTNQPVPGVPNTVYARVNNLGYEQANGVVVTFWWSDPSLAITAAQPIGTAFVNSPGRQSRVVQCPEPWVPVVVNGGHECLLVRIWDVTADPMTTPEWDARVNRHLGQRNIHVVPAVGGNGALPLKLSVGQLFGQNADIAVARHAPTTMPWLQLHGGVRGVFPTQAIGTGAITLAAPGQIGTGAAVQAAGDGAQVVFATGDQTPPPGQAQVYRVTASQGGQVIGGYTVVHTG